MSVAHLSVIMCKPSHMSICTEVCVCVPCLMSDCVCVNIFMLKQFFSPVRPNNLLCLLTVCGAVPVRLPYNSVWLTVQRQTAAAFSQSISYYTAFPPYFSAANTAKMKKKKMLLLQAKQSVSLDIKNVKAQYCGTNGEPHVSSLD